MDARLLDAARRLNTTFAAGSSVFHVEEDHGRYLIELVHLNGEREVIAGGTNVGEVLSHVNGMVQAASLLQNHAVDMHPPRWVVDQTQQFARDLTESEIVLLSAPIRLVAKVPNTPPTDIYIGDGLFAELPSFEALVGALYGMLHIIIAERRNSARGQWAAVGTPPASGGLRIQPREHEED